jgi:DNA processing protein
VALGEPEYPALLARIYDPPPFLWVRGRIAPDDARAVAVVGTRKASDYGRRVAEAFGRGLAERAVTVVSGLAYGIDVTAHRAALDAGGRTVAVLGSGVDRVYPSRHGPEVRRILEGDAGAVVSELPLGASPDAPNFPRRNRIVSGMSLGTVVAEARETGGALLTAAIALEQNREVFAVPAPVFSDYPGTNRLVQKGWAALAAGPDDVLDALAPLLPAAAAPAPEAAPAAPEAPPDLTAVERRLLGALDGTPRPLDAVCAASGVDAPTALVYLLQLEFRGLVRQLAGKQFYRA